MIFSYNYCLKLMESGQISGIRSFQFITITVGVLDQWSIVDCNAVFRTQFHYIGITVSYSLFCII